MFVALVLGWVLFGLAILYLSFASRKWAVIQLHYDYLIVWLFLYDEVRGKWKNELDSLLLKDTSPMEDFSPDAVAMQLMALASKFIAGLVKEQQGYGSGITMTTVALLFKRKKELRGEKVT